MIAPSHGILEIPLANNFSKFYVVRYNSEIENWEVLSTPVFYDKNECDVYVASLNEKYGNVDIKD